MAAEIEQHAAALRGRRGLPPCGLPELGPPPFEPRFVSRHLPERAVVDQPAERAMVGVPAAILEDRQQGVLRARVLDQLDRIFNGRRNRLVHDNREAHVERAPGERSVRAVDCRHNDQVVLGCALP